MFIDEGDDPPLQCPKCGQFWNEYHSCPKVRIEMDQDILQSWVDKIKEEGRDLTKWEIQFVDSIEEQLSLIGRLSERQREILERIYTEKTP